MTGAAAVTTETIVGDFEVRIVRMVRDANAGTLMTCAQFQAAVTRAAEVAFPQLLLELAEQGRADLAARVASHMAAAAVAEAGQ